MTRSQRSFFYPHTSISRLFFHLRLLFHLKASFQEVDLLSHTPNTPDQSAPTDPDALCRLLVELGRHLRPLLPSDREWLEEGAIEAVNNIPVDAGQVADVLVGMKGSLRVAIKHYRFHSSSNYLPAYVRFCEEVLGYCRLRSQSLVPFIGVYSTPEYPLCLVFEYLDHLNLREYLRANKDAGRRKLLLEIARGVEYLHSMDVIHKNLKITNILVDARGHARIGGLGAAFLPSSTPGVDVDAFFCGAAPELSNHRRFGLADTRITEATDVYAFGVLAWETFAGQAPFSGEMTYAAVVSMWKGRQPARPNHPELSNRLWRTIEGSWRVDPTRRVTIDKVVAVLEAEIAAHQSSSRVL